MAENPICEGLLSLPEVWSGRRELYEATVQGVQLVFGILRLRYKTDLPNTARANITEFVLNKGNISIAILTEDVDDSIMPRLQMVNPLRGETGLDRVFDETFAARVALQGSLADEVPHYDLAVMQDIVTPPGCRSGVVAGSTRSVLSIPAASG